MVIGALNVPPLRDLDVTLEDAAAQAAGLTRL